MTLLAVMPELGKANRRKIAVLAGLASYANESDKTFNAKLKMVAIVAVMRKLLVIINNCCKQFYLGRSYVNA